VTCRNHDCGRSCDGQPACVPALFATQLLGDNVPRVEAKSTGYGSPFQHPDPEPASEGGDIVSQRPKPLLKSTAGQSRSQRPHSEGRFHRFRQGQLRIPREPSYFQRYLLHHPCRKESSHRRSLGMWEVHRLSTPLSILHSQLGSNTHRRAAN